MLFEFYVKVYLKLIWVKFNLDIKPLFKFWLNLLIPNLGEADFLTSQLRSLQTHESQDHSKLMNHQITPRSLQYKLNL